MSAILLEQLKYTQAERMEWLLVLFLVVLVFIFSPTIFKFLGKVKKTFQDINQSF
jgi:hypothetical protein